MSRISFAFLILIAALNCFAGDPTISSNEDGFQSGIKLYQDQKYSEAAEKFKKEYADGKDFAALHYNWGLASLKLKKRGLAVGLWRRALFLDPDFRPALQALEYISHEMPKDNGEALSTWGALHTKILDRASLNKFFVSTWLFCALGGFLFIRYLSARGVSLKKELPMPKAPTVAVALLIAFLVLGGLSVLKIVSLNEIHATVTEASVSLHTGPSAEDNIIFDVLEGFDVIVDTISTGWVQISLSSGQSGWVRADDLFQHTGRAKLW